MNSSPEYRLLAIYVTVGLALLSGCQGTGSKSDASSQFSDPKVRELAEAACQGNTGRIEALIADGVDVNGQGKDGVTPLIFAMTHNKDGVRYLLEHGANPNQQTIKGQSAMRLAARCPDSDYLRMVLKHRGNPNLVCNVKDGFFRLAPTAFYDAIIVGPPENVRLMIRAGADINSRDHSDITPLMCAGLSDRFDIVYILLELGADFRPRNSLGFSIATRILDSKLNPSSEPGKWKQKCTDFLKAHGVDFEKEKEVLRRADAGLPAPQTPIPGGIPTG